MKTGLIIEDSRVIRVIVGKALQEMGFTPLEAEDGKTALEMCKKELPDFIIMDWILPVMDGMAFLNEFHKLPDNEKVTIIFCSSKNNPEDIQMALDNGATEYIMKPFDSEILRFKLGLAGLL